MSHLRTYRFLPLLVGMLLLFGAAVPVVQAACSMLMVDMQEHEMPCIDHEEAPVVPPRHEHGSDGAFSDEASGSYRVCCQPIDAAPPAVITSNTTQRMDAPSASVLTDAAITAVVSGTVVASTTNRASPLPPPAHRQALLATFLI